MVIAVILNREKAILFYYTFLFIIFLSGPSFALINLSREQSVDASKQAQMKCMCLNA